MSLCRSSSGHPIHIINPFWDASGGSEWEALQLYRILSRKRKVTLWSMHVPDPLLADQASIRKIEPWKLKFPTTGTFIFVGIYFNIGTWVRLARPRRIIIILNTNDHAELVRKKRQLSKYRRIPIETVYVGGLKPGGQEYGSCRADISPIDIQRFSPREPVCPSLERPFTVGRLSRDVPVKHHPDDPALYLKLASRGTAVRVMGGTVLSAALADKPGIEVLAAGAEDAASFLHSIDCFYYRTAPEWFESFGRVVLEAMACGLPVVCENRGGYCDYIRHGENGFLFDTDAEAFEIIMQLRSNPGMCMKIGAAARQTVERLYSSDHEADVFSYYSR